MTQPISNILKALYLFLVLSHSHRLLLDMQTLIDSSLAIRILLNGFIDHHVVQVFIISFLWHPPLRGYNLSKKGVTLMIP